MVKASDIGCENRLCSALNVKHLLVSCRFPHVAGVPVARKSCNASDCQPSKLCSTYFKRTEMRLLNLKSGFLRRRMPDSPLSVRPQPEEAQKWSESFTALMASKYGSSLYHAFLLREFSNENLEFWLAVEDYKNSKPQKMAAKAQQIYNDFVAVQAAKEINLDAETRLITLNNVQSNNPDEHAFDRAQKRVQHMMERDSYLRFLQSNLFLELAHPERYSESIGDVTEKSSPA
ncbi:regulator of G-protein signaling 8-like [Daphnia carinata]|uniref:regulator of G-protein signaling 8-like n=1 Tax=Daphnia carinata TaxID=120202 RepID=UPI00257B40D9|nr:regulator of G-protein signaling 8-like [Daphnia carinata]